MNDLRSPLEDRPYRPASRPMQSERVITTPQYYRSWFQSLRQHKFFPLASVSLAVLAFAGIISYAYNEGSQTSVNATTPIITASTEDYIEKPANPGGMDVPFQDAIVFDQLQSKGQTASNNIESLLPTPEQPVAVAEKTESTTAPTIKDEKATTAEPKTETMAPTEAASATPAVTTTHTASTDDVAKKLDAVAPASAPATTKIETGNYRIQLGAFRDAAAAKTAWSKIQKQFSSQLTSVTPDFPRADLGAKGTFYRVQGINLSKATADELCHSINAAKGGSCIVVK